MQTSMHFAHPQTLLDKVTEVLKETGPEKFFSSPEEKVKIAREGLVAYFFTLALKKYTGKDWWVAQPLQVARSYPDFDFVSFGESPLDFRAEQVELTEIHPRTKSFEEAIKVIMVKRMKYGHDPVKFSLLVFVNHEKSEEWIEILKEQLASELPFISVWAINLLFKNGGKELDSLVLHRIRPLPIVTVIASIADSELHKRQPIPDHMEEKVVNGEIQIVFKHESIKSSLKELYSSK